MKFIFDFGFKIIYVGEFYEWNNENCWFLYIVDLIKEILNDMIGYL